MNSVWNKVQLAGIRSKGGPRLVLAALVSGFALAGGQVPLAHAATFTVDSFADALDAIPGDGVCDDGGSKCTLRAAVMETNALPGADTITLPAGTYTLTLGSQLVINDDLTLTGAGPGSTIIQAATASGLADFRVFDITSGDVSISGVTIR